MDQVVEHTCSLLSQPLQKQLYHQGHWVPFDVMNNDFEIVLVKRRSHFVVVTDGFSNIDRVSHYLGECAGVLTHR